MSLIGFAYTNLAFLLVGMVIGACVGLVVLAMLASSSRFGGDL